MLDSAFRLRKFKVTDAWSLKFVRQRGNYRYINDSRYFRFWSHTVPCPIPIKTRTLSYRKDDRAMRPIYGCPENFWQSLSTPTATFPESFNVLLFWSILWMRVRNSEVRSFTHSWDNRGYSKIGQSLDTPTLSFLQIFHGLLFGWTLWMYRPNLQYVALPVPEIIAIAVLGSGCEPPILGKGRP